MVLRIEKLLFVAGLVIVSSPLARGQNADHPLLNSLGRYFGVDYTMGGYHSACDGRFDVVTARHPATGYHSRGQYYQPASPAGFTWESSTAGFGAMPSPASSPPSVPSGNSSPVTEKVVAPEETKPPTPPVGPPPEWLERYLDKKNDTQPLELIPTPDSNNDVNLLDPGIEESPSDQLLKDVSPLVPPKEAFRWHSDWRPLQKSLTAIRQDSDRDQQAASSAVTNRYSGATYAGPR